MVENIVDELSIRSETGVVPILDAGAGDLVATLVGTLSTASGFVVPAVRKKLLPDVTVGRHPHADIGMVMHVLLHRGGGLLRRLRPCFTDSGRKGDRCSGGRRAGKVSALGVSHR